MNNYFNITLPEFQTKYGEDWQGFLDLVQPETDTWLRKIFELYYLNNINNMNQRATERLLASLEILFDATDTLQNKKQKLRTYVSQYKQKSLGAVYLDLAEDIVGTPGVVYSGFEFGAILWGESVWANAGGGADPTVWADETTAFKVYIDVMTVDSGELDQIEALYRQSSLLPAYYLIHLIDSSFNILRTLD